MPFLIYQKTNNSHKVKKAFIATTPKKAFDYNYILCYLRILCRKAFGKFYLKPNAAVKGSVSSGEENKNKEKGIGGNADANTLFNDWIVSEDGKSMSKKGMFYKSTPGMKGIRIS